MSLGKRIIVDIHYDQKRVAIMEDGELAEFYMEDDENQAWQGTYTAAGSKCTAGNAGGFCGYRPG